MMIQVPLTFLQHSKIHLFQLKLIVLIANEIRGKKKKKYLKSQHHIYQNLSCGRFTIKTSDDVMIT